ncbi:Ankyrin-repeat protein [Orpheovirus IHUMI-LCC2]|uniref:Ankyrin-repeat protein n=1 Tax=Orpheovirus IHUMI-LCC2 TaxID=2023057 RepID=A0A2I2L3T6_9VIRU|nr:Ankyrin-repeat protein [Orpheovirus IHUMI-LCC2]SNW62212.1 Ankyrin-repeat protein [Orpheovirus IHUMI-LCC2]
MNIVEDILIYNICPYLSQREICNLFNCIKRYRSLYKYHTILFPYKSFEDCIKDDAIVSYKNLIINGEVKSYKVGLKCSCKYKNIHFIKYFISIREKTLQFIEYNIINGFDKEKLLISKHENKYDDIDEIFKYAAALHDRELLDYFLNNTSDKCYGFYGACEHSNLYLLSNLFENIDIDLDKNINITPKWKDLYDIDTMVLRGSIDHCVQGNNKFLFEKLYKVAKDKSITHFINWDNILLNSCINGSPNNITELCMEMKEICGELALYYACKFANMELIEKLEGMRVQDYTYALCGCACSGNIELFNKYKDRSKEDYFLINCMIQAIYGNQLKMVKYLITLGVHNIDYAIELSIKLGNKDIYEYLMTLTNDITYNALVDLLALESVEVFNKYKDMRKNVDVRYLRKGVLMRTCRKGRYERVRYLLNNYNIERHDIIDSLEEANLFGNYDIALYLFNILK